MGNLWRFIVIAAVVEAIAIPVTGGTFPSWLMDVIIGLVILYLIFLAVRGWNKQIKLDLPPAMAGKKVKSRHWHVF